MKSKLKILDYLTLKRLLEICKVKYLFTCPYPPGHPQAWFPIVVHFTISLCSPPLSHTFSLIQHTHTSISPSGFI
ncbi:hypothetical protein LXL04_015814 [Taraxacum kok-saghyz]